MSFYNNNNWKISLEISYVDPKIKNEIMNTLRVEMAQFRQESYDETHDSCHFPEPYDEWSGYCGEYSEAYY